jgi:hypothetical protein
LLGARPAMTTPYPTVPGVTFKAIDGFPGYCVGDDGSVWSRHKRMKRPGHVSRPSRPGHFWGLSDEWRRLCPSVNTIGYVRVGLSRDGRRCNRYIHDLVLTAFVGPRPPGALACHFPDRDRTNNRASNLRWDTPKANARDAVVHGTNLAGTRHPKAKITDRDVREIRRLKAEGLTGKQIGELFGMNRNSINRIAAGKAWAHVE